MGHGKFSMNEKAAQDTRSNDSMLQKAAADLQGIRVILINTTHPGNIGATARAMKVMGLGNLHLVTPKIYPHADATAMASGADDILQQATLHETLDSALAGCGLVLGTSARLRSLAMPQLDARAAAATAVSEVAQHNVALLFGRERYGLTNEEMQCCNQLVHIPANPEYSSLNLAQAVQVLAYEMRMAALRQQETPDKPLAWQPVDGQEMDRYFQHLEQTLLDIRFLNPAQPKKLMMRLRRLFNRARPDQNEINILRGILTAAQEQARGKQRKNNE
jgi:tRNA (cytidine32/uridine32-2'-O)-methyltransferase